MSERAKKSDTRRNVFMLPATGSLRMELALLAIPVAAILAVICLASVQKAGTDRHDTGKLKLRVTSAVPAADPVVAREEALLRAQIQFALSKVAQAPHIVLASADTADGEVSVATPVTESKSLRKVAKRAKRAKRPVDIRPRRLRKATVQARRRTAQRARKVPASAQRTDANWIATAFVRQISRPVEAANATIAPVRETLSRTVVQAGEALDSLRRKIL